MGNNLFLLIAGLIPMIVGFVWYGPIFGNAWMRTNGFTKETLDQGNMAVILGLSYLLSVVLAFSLLPLVIHQFGLYQLLGPHIKEEVGGAEMKIYLENFKATYGDMHRSFKHGALHGGIAAVFTALPLIAINALFERRGAKYIGIHFGYWFVTMTLMGGILCQWF